MLIAARPDEFNVIDVYADVDIPLTVGDESVKFVDPTDPKSDVARSVAEACVEATTASESDTPDWSLLCAYTFSVAAVTVFPDPITDVSNGKNARSM